MDHVDSERKQTVKKFTRFGVKIVLLVIDYLV